MKDFPKGDTSSPEFIEQIDQHFKKYSNKIQDVFFEELENTEFGKKQTEYLLLDENSRKEVFKDNEFIKDKKAQIVKIVYRMLT